MVKLLTFILALCLLGCSSSDEKAVARAEKAISKKLKDPSSAKFDGAYIVRTKSLNNVDYTQVAVCGVVDGKNSFGAYTGGSRYVAVFREDKDNLYGPSQVEIEDGDKRATVDSVKTNKRTTVFEKVYWNEYCVDEFHPASYSGTIH